MNSKPCKGCLDRKVGCHSGCEKHLLASLEHSVNVRSEKLKKLYRADVSSKDQYFIPYIARQRETREGRKTA